VNKMDFGMDASTQEKPLAKRAKRIAIFAAPALVVGGGALIFATMLATGPKPEEKAGNNHPPAVQFAIATARPASISVNVQGEARPRVEAALAAQVAGRIVWASPAFVEGGAFREGEVLARIEAADYELAVVRARSQVAQAQEAMAREEAEGELARQDWEALGTGEASSLALREPQLAQARATLAAAQAAQRSAELDLARTHIRAPFTGRLRERRANIGDYVAPGAAVATMFSTDVMEVRVPLTDSDLASLRTPVGFSATAAAPGPVAQVSISQAGAARNWQGRLVRTEAAIDPRTRLVYGIVAVNNPFAGASPLAPGMFVNVRLDGSARETMVAAPRSALKRNEYVYVIGADNSVDIRQVRPAQTTADEVFFRDGVVNGDRVITSTLASPRDGMAVTPIDENGRAVAAEGAPQPQPQAPEALRGTTP
jgi:RND family efflux transporter MFP subunit